MTHQDFSLEHKDWITVGKFSEISCLDDTSREFLESFSGFIFLKNQGLVPDSGIVLSPLRPGIVLPPIVDIESVPVQGTPFDKYILVKPS